MIKTFSALLAALSLSACVQTGDFGNLLFDDLENPSVITDGDFAVGDEVFISVAELGTQNVIDLTTIQVVASDPTVFLADPSLSEVDGEFVLHGFFLGEGPIDLELLDAQGALVDRVTIIGRPASDIQIFGARLGGPSEEVAITDSVNIFQEGIAPLFVRLLEVEGGQTQELKGQIPAILETTDPTSAFLLPLNETEVLLGTIFSPDLGILELPAVTLVGGIPGSNLVTFRSNPDFAPPFSKDLAVNTISFADNFTVESIVALDLLSTSGTITSFGKLTDNSPILGGRYVFTDISANGPLLDIIQAENAFDSALFTATAAGEATINVDLVDLQGSIVASDTISFEVSP